MDLAPSVRFDRVLDVVTSNRFGPHPVEAFARAVDCETPAGRRWLVYMLAAALDVGPASNPGAAFGTVLGLYDDINVGAV